MKDFWRLVNAWLNGTYRVFPWRTLFVLIFVGAYAINPFDLIPDFIPVVGYLDDATVIAFVVESIRRDLDKFIAWERPTPPPGVVLTPPQES